MNRFCAIDELFAARVARWMKWLCRCEPGCAPWLFGEILICGAAGVPAPSPGPSSSPAFDTLLSRPSSSASEASSEVASLP